MLKLVLPNMNMTESFLATLYQQSLYPEFHAGHSIKEKAFRQHGSCGNTGFISRGVSNSFKRYSRCSHLHGPHKGCAPNGLAFRGTGSLHPETWRLTAAP